MGYFRETYGPAVYDVFFESAKGCAKRLIESCSGSIGSGTRVLDVGAGTGHVACGVAARFGESIVVGVDVEEEALELARHKASNYSLGNVEFKWGDALDLPFRDGSFDAVLASQVVGGAEKQSDMLSEMLRVARPGAVIGVAKSNPDQNEVAQWIDDVALAIANRRGVRPPRPEENPWKNTLLLHKMLERLEVRNIKTERMVSAHLSFATFMIGVMTQGRHLLDLVDYVVQCPSGDREAQARGCWEFLEIGREIMDEKFGGSLEVECEVVSGKKAA